MADGSRSLYPNVAANFDLETFSTKEFLVKDFIEGLSQNITSTRRSQGIATASGSAFDPKPYIRNFEAALERIKDLNQDLAEKESELKEGVRRAELDHGRRVQELGKKLEDTLDKFQKLDVNIGGTAIRIGGQLEELDKQRRRATDAKFLIECFTEFNRGDTSRLEKMRKSGRIDDAIRCAIISRQLISIAEKLDLSSGDRTRGLIEKFSESLEKDLLSQFDIAYRQMDVTAMKGCAQVLHDFNGGASVKALFVNQHEFFIAKQHLVNNEIILGGDTWDRLPDPDAIPPPLEPSVAEIINSASMVVKTESALIKDVFPIPEDVTKMFLQRIFQQTLQQRLEMVLDKAETISPLAFLRTLQTARNSIDGLVEDLKSHGLIERPRKITNSEIIMCLDQNMEDLFTPYLEGSVRYIERERKSLQDLYESILFKFNTYHARRKKMANTTMLDRWKTSIQTSTATARDRVIAQLQDSDASGSKRRDQLLRLAGIGSIGERKDRGDRLAEIELDETDGNLSVDISKRMLKWLAEAIGRSIELSSSTDTPKDAFVFLNLLLDNVGLYVETALEGCLDYAASAETAKTEPDLSYFGELNETAIILSLMFKTINTALIPLSQTSLTIRREMLQTSNRFLQKIEERVTFIMSKTIDIVLNHLNNLLMRQSKRDFRPRDDDVQLTTLQTPTCASISAFLTKLHYLSKASLSGSNLTLFLQEIAIGFRTRFLDHLKRNTINAAGGVMLIKDIVCYQSLFRDWDTPELGEGLKEGFELLHEIGNLYVVPAGALKNKLRSPDGLLARAKRELLVPYLVKREDYLSSGIDRVLLE